MAIKTLAEKAQERVVARRLKEAEAHALQVMNREDADARAEDFQNFIGSLDVLPQTYDVRRRGDATVFIMRASGDYCSIEALNNDAYEVLYYVDGSKKLALQVLTEDEMLESVLDYLQHARSGGR